MATLALTSTSAASLKVDAVVVGIGSGPKGAVLAPGADALDAALGKGLLKALVSLGATGRAGEVVRLATLGATTAPVVLAVGLGEAPKRGASYPAEALRRAAGSATRSLAGPAKVALVFAPAGGDAGVGAVSEGALLGAYSFDTFRHASLAGRQAPVAAVTVVTDDARTATAKAAAARAEALVASVLMARDLVNTPPGDLNPVSFAAAALAACKDLDLEVEVLDEKALKKAKFGGIVGVGQGSANPPRLVRVTYRHAAAKAKVALVGKGITFDSGGLSLKPPAGMETMKSDMAGAAAVLTTLIAVARLKPELEVTGWMPLAENMPSGTAIRPSDVLSMYGGRTVEVLNTDAEGRLVLADAIVRACEDSPDYLVDVATLTGAQLVALGTRTAGVMGHDGFRDRVVAAATEAGEAMWAMPLPEELRKGLDSEVADLKNVAGRDGGMLSAAIFLKEFVAEGVEWAHVDIAGPSFNTADPHGYTHRGATGAAVRTLVSLLEDLSR